jgi:ribosomal-protein-serine acetyltransferase
VGRARDLREDLDHPQEVLTIRDPLGVADFSTFASRRLRPIRMADTAAIHALVEGNRTHLRPWMPWADQDAAATAQFVAHAMGESASGTALHLVVLDGTAIAGICGFHSFVWAHRATSLGYWLSEGAQGKGLVTEAIRELLDYAFGPLELHRVELRAAPDNARSLAVAQRLGFTREGVLRDAERVGERWVDSVVHSMLSGEWARA